MCVFRAVSAFPRAVSRGISGAARGPQFHAAQGDVRSRARLARKTRKFALFFPSSYILFSSFEYKYSEKIKSRFFPRFRARRLIILAAAMSCTPRGIFQLSARGAAFSARNWDFQGG